MTTADQCFQEFYGVMFGISEVKTDAEKGGLDLLDDSGRRLRSVAFGMSYWVSPTW